VEAVRKIGYHGEDAIHTIDRLIIADLDLSKATGLAKVAKDAAPSRTSKRPKLWRRSSRPSSSATPAPSAQPVWW